MNTRRRIILLITVVILMPGLLVMAAEPSKWWECTPEGHNLEVCRSTAVSHTGKPAPQDGNWAAWVEGTGLSTCTRQGVIGAGFSKECYDTVATPTTEATATPTTATKVPHRGLACLRINFEVGATEARRGTYVVRMWDGRVLAEWWADTGWEDSGEIRGIDIPSQAVHVYVTFVKGDGSEVLMKILNPAPVDETTNPDGTHGWIARDVCHALEVQWPNE